MTAFKNRPIDKNLFNQYGDDVSGFLKPIYASRQTHFAQLDLSLKNLLPPNFAQLNKAHSILAKALNLQQRILIVGDFDCDGATACAVMMKSLRLMGAQSVDFLVPNRFKHGYGLSVAIVELALVEKSPDIIITVDNGISSIDGVALAKKHNIKVIITDHHLPADTLPQADCIINPNLTDCQFPSKHLAGVGVAFYLCVSLKSYLLKQHYFAQNNIAVPDLKTLLDIVALGTVADVVKLDQNNRILVREGLRRIRNNQACIGIKALMNVAKKTPDQLSASDFGFALAPRINAAGRLSDMSIGIRCLMSEDLAVAMQYANALNTCNEQRKAIQEDMQTQAQTILANQTFDGVFSICLYQKDWHEGVVGIVAGKLCRDNHCPSAVFAKNGEFLKGSLRSIADIHIKDLLTEIDKNNPNLIDKFGGHAMAAGMSLKQTNFEAFSQVFDSTIKQQLNQQLPSGELLTDGELLEQQITLDNAQLLLDNAPWGQGFEEPIFQGIFSTHNPKIVGEKHLKCELKLKDGKQYFSSIAFFQAPIEAKYIQVAYKLNINYYRGVKSLQLMVEQMDAYLLNNNKPQNK